MALGLTQPLTEMSNMNLPWGEGGLERLARKADSFISLLLSASLRITVHSVLSRAFSLQVCIPRDLWASTSSNKLNASFTFTVKNGGWGANRKRLRIVIHNICVILADITNVKELQKFQLKNIERSVTKTGIRYLKFDTAFRSTFYPPSPPSPRGHDGS
jgi:hypothetical protein